MIFERRRFALLGHAEQKKTYEKDNFSIHDDQKCFFLDKKTATVNLLRLTRFIDFFPFFCVCEF